MGILKKLLNSIKHCKMISFLPILNPKIELSAFSRSAEPVHVSATALAAVGVSCGQRPRLEIPIPSWNSPWREFSQGKPRSVSLEGIPLGPARPFPGVLRRFPACPAPCFCNHKITHFLKRPFEPDFCDYDPILDPKMASPDRLLALFFRLPTSLSEFSKKLHPSQAKSLFLLVRRLRKSLFFNFKII